MRVQDILNECRKQLAQKENRSVIDVASIGRDASKTIQKPMVALHSESLFAKLGVKVLDKLTNNVGYPVINSQTTMELQETENPQDFIDNLSFDSITLKPRRFFSYVQYDRQIILSNDADVVGAMTEDLEASILEEVERKAFNELYVDGGAATITSYSDIVALELEAAGKYISNPVYLVSPLAASRLKMLAFNNSPVVLGEKLITGKPFVETPLLSGDRVILGDFTKMVVGVWDKLSNYTFNPVSKAKDGLVEIIVNSYFDAGAVNPNAFVYAKVTARTDN